MRKYDHLFFDLDNTLWDFTTNSYLAMKHTMEQIGLLSRLPSFDVFFDVYEAINHSLWAEYHARQITKQSLIVKRFSQSLNQFGIAELNWAELNHLYLENMARETALFPGAFETLTYLRDKGYQMHIITNGFVEVQRKKLSNCELDEFFTKVFISEEIQTTKPHRKIFEYALKSANARKKQSMMIGDSWETDIAGAMNFGIDQAMFLNEGKNELPEPLKSTQKIENGTFLELKPPTKTWFINEISNLSAIL